MLRFLGHGSAFAIKKKNNSAFYKNQDELFLFDCGETVFKEIVELNVLNGIKKINIILTHFHSDHCGSLGTLVFYLSANGFNRQNIRIIYPIKQDLKQLLKLFNIDDECTIICSKELLQLKLTSVKQKHSDIFSYGYIFNDNGKKCYYSGDTCEIPPIVLQGFLNGSIKFMYMDTRIDKKNNYHLTLDELKSLIPYNERQRVICMHTSDSSCKNDYEKENFLYAGDFMYNKLTTFAKENNL